MNVAEVDWSVLWSALALLIVAVLISGGLIYSVNHFGELAEQEFSNERGKLLRVRGEYQTIDDEKNIIVTFLPQYETLEERGIIGRERRLSWIETLRGAAESIKLPSLRYELYPQEEFETQFPIPVSTYKVFTTNMNLQVGLLHEGDLAVLLRELNRTAVGIFSVSKCYLRGPNPAVVMDPKAKNVSASCDLQWFTIRRPEDESA